MSGLPGRIVPVTGMEGDRKKQESPADMPGFPYRRWRGEAV